MRHAKPPGCLIDLPHGGVHSWVNTIYPAWDGTDTSNLFTPLVATWHIEPLIVGQQTTDYPDASMIKDAVILEMW